MSVPVENLLQQHPELWRADGTAAKRAVVPSGFAALDAQLPGGGWPCPALIEVLSERPGIGELSLLLPALRYLSECGEEPAMSFTLSLLRERLGASAPALAWFNPPHLPYPPALAERGLAVERLLVSKSLTDARVLWAMEQSLRSGACVAVLAWAEAASTNALRRLKLAAHEGACLGILFRSLRHRAHSSPATVRLALSVDETALVVEIVKVQGGKSATVRLHVS